MWWLETCHIVAPQWRALEAVLDDGERERAARFHFERDREVYVAARAMARGLLAHASGRAPTGFRFAIGDHGKPEVVVGADELRWRLNLSHTRGLAAAALTAEHDIGIDVEWLGREPAATALAERMFAPDERRAVDVAGPAERNGVFLTYWTLKEAYVKAIGMGLSQPLQTFVVTLDPLGIAFDDPAADGPGSWVLKSARPTPHHVLALALRHPTPSRVHVALEPAPLEGLVALASRPGCGRI